MSTNNEKINYRLINSEFNFLSKFFFKKIGKYWWFLNSSRLDLAPWGIPVNQSLFKKGINFFKCFTYITYLISLKIFDKSCDYEIKKKHLRILN